jgi:hypothetical protein
VLFGASNADDSNGRIGSLGLSTLEHIVNRHPYDAAVMDEEPLAVDVPREFHRRMAAIIDAVQTAIWQEGVHDLLGYATDYAFGQRRGLQTLVLKSKHRSAYVRLHWDTVMRDTDADRQLVDEAIQNAISELR